MEGVGWGAGALDNWRFGSVASVLLSNAAHRDWDSMGIGVVHSMLWWHRTIKDWSKLALNLASRRLNATLTTTGPVTNGFGFRYLTAISEPGINNG